MIEKMIKIELTEAEHSLLIDALISARERWLDLATIDTTKQPGSSALNTIARLLALQCERTQALIDKLIK